MGKIKTKVKLDNIEALARQMEETYVVRVGILGSTATEKAENSNLTMEQLGTIHEFGCIINVTEKMRKYLMTQGLFLRKETTQIKIPARSFLRASLLNQTGKQAVIDDALNNIDSQVYGGFLKEDLDIAFSDFGDYSEKKLEKIKKLITPQMLALAVADAARRRVKAAFETDGFGKWHPITQFTREHRKGNPDNNILVDTGQLKDSIRAEVSTQ